MKIPIRLYQKFGNNVMKYGTFVDLLYDDWEFRMANQYNSTNLPQHIVFTKWETFVNINFMKV
ncbi:MAG: hypothetical protein BWK75_06780 [Candidatus Altiarchaeales archaeon A3]|nr:MAG: hypothetical protein BWK75_06780 [Candidatus Altiarchaeales archaeon A3]